MKNFWSVFQLLCRPFLCAACGQSLTAIAKLAPDAVIGEGLSIRCFGGSSLSADVSDWLAANNIPAN